MLLITRSCNTEVPAIATPLEQAGKFRVKLEVGSLIEGILVVSRSVVFQDIRYVYYFYINS